MLIQADLGIEVVVADRGRGRRGRYGKDIAPDEVKAILAAEVEKVLAPVAQAAW